MPRPTLAGPSRLLLIAVVALLPVHLCCCSSSRAQAKPTVQPRPAEHACCAAQPAPREPAEHDETHCDCGDTYLAVPTDAPAIVTVYAGLHSFDLPALPAAVLSDLAVSPRPMLALLDTPPPRDARTLRAQRCLLTI